MTPSPTTQVLSHVLAELGHRVADTGPAAHHRELSLVASAAEALTPGAAAALADPVAPDIVRARALAVVSRTLSRELRGDAATTLVADVAGHVTEDGPVIASTTRPQTPGVGRLQPYRAVSPAA